MHLLATVFDDGLACSKDLPLNMPEKRTCSRDPSLLHSSKAPDEDQQTLKSKMPLNVVSESGFEYRGLVVLFLCHS